MFTDSSNPVIKKLYVSNSKVKYLAIYCVFSIPKDFNYSSLVTLLTPGELNILSSLKGNHKVNKFLVGRYISKICISKLLSIDNLCDISIEKGIFNFPVVKININKNVQVSISYCDNIISAIAFYEECPMAIDIEVVCRRKVSSIKRVLNFPIDHSIDFNRDALIISQWTCLESIGKILKIGINFPFSFYEPKENIVTNKELITTFKFLYPFKCSSFFIDDFVLTFSYPSNCYLLHDFI